MSKPYKITTKQRPLYERFWEKVDSSGGPDACWPWLGVRVKGGYGRIGVGTERGHVQVPSARIAWELENGPSVPGEWALHRCDNPPCVNPKHIFMGTPKQNSEDMSAKRRAPFGERQHAHVLCEEDVIQIRALSFLGVPLRELVKIFGLPKVTIHKAATGKTWPHVPEAPVPVRIKMRRLTNEEVNLLCGEFATGEFTQRALAKKYGVSEACASLILNGHSRRSA
jgi:hypothetical protein